MSMLDKNYANTLEQIKTRVREAQYKALQTVNKELVLMYWDIGKIIIEKQKIEKWGKAIVERLAEDLQAEFQGVKGFSFRNVWRMRQFYSTYSQSEILPQLVAQIPWGQNALIMNKSKNPLEQEFYIKMTIKYGWSRSTLKHKMVDKEFERWALKQDNFSEKLPATLSHKAEFVNRDEYNLDFLLLTDEFKERDLEDQIVSNIVKFLATMGGDFAFVGKQFPIRFNDVEYFIDLLFFHRSLRCLIAIELKIGKFEPEHLGKMSFYLSALEDLEKKAGENSPIGIILCKEKDRMLVEYTLRDINKPIGVASYVTYKSETELPDNVKKLLPSVIELKKRLELLLEGNKI